MVTRRLVVVAAAMAAVALALPAGASEVVAAGIVYGGVYSSVYVSTPDIMGLNASAGQNVTFSGTFHDTAQSPGYYQVGVYSIVKAILDFAWDAHTTPFAGFAILVDGVTPSSIAYSNAWDDEIDKFASHVQGFLDQGEGRSLIVAPFPEMNGYWTPTYGCNPAAFKAAYLKVRDAFRNRGMDETKVRFAFAPNGWTAPACGSIADYYPGDEYVDVNAFSAYNFGAETAAACVDGAFGWETPYQVLSGPTEELRAIAPLKPIIIAQTAAPRTGCGATAANGGQDQWVRDLFAFAANDPNIVGLIWFNIDNTSGGETDWRIWGENQATQGWRDAMGGLATRYAWPLTDWFQPGPLVVDTPPGPCPVGSTCDTAAFVNTSGKWYRYDALGASDPITAFYFGNPGDVPFMGDWDCDGLKTPGLYRQSDGFVYLRNSNTQGIADITFFFGNPGDVPVAGDFNQDGCDTLSIYRPSQGRFFIINQLGQNDGGLGAADYDFLFGNPGDTPFVGDFNGDGIDTIGLYRVTTGFVYFRNTLNTGIADLSFFYGDPGDKIVAGDWDGDRDDTVAVYRPSTRRFYVNFDNAQGIADYTVYVGSYVAAARG